MEKLIRFRNISVLLLLMNIVFISIIGQAKILAIIAAILLLIIYLYINLIPIKDRLLGKRLNIMYGGYELIVDITICMVLEVILYIFLLSNYSINTWVITINTIIALILTSFSFLNGFFRVIFFSSQVTMLQRILVLIFWWVPVINIIILCKCCKIAKHEFMFELSKHNLDNARKENEVCKTKYPIVMIHGIFFRDWMFINYWGRVPKELIKNGAKIFYGKQQSATSVSRSAQELKENILKIIHDTGCEKVNIIAHSKGGLDARYAISCLGLNKYVASLTTINTPHRGCKFVDYLLDKLPKSFINYVHKKYNAVFTKLGDKDPDFLSGVNDLRATRCKEFNEKVKDAEGVLYQSVMSKMKGPLSADFPLNICYILCKMFDGENDGLVSIESAKWGSYLGLIIPEKKGISHGDVIDLTRKNLPGFDVCEFYVDLIKKLKEKGF